MTPNGARRRCVLPGQRGYVTAHWLAPIRLVAALLIVVGLAVSVPPSFGTVEGDHFGLLLHPLLPHVHGSAGARASRDDHRMTRDDVGSIASELAWTTVSQTPAIHGPAADQSFRSALNGIVLPALLAGVLLQLRQIKTASVRLTQQHWRRPPAPPPRLTTPVFVTY